VTTVLLTGGTGFLGTQVARRLLARPDLRVVALVRGGGDDEAAWRLGRAWADWPELVRALDGRVEVLAGDVSAVQLGLAAAAYEDLVGRVTHVVHTAADLRIDAPVEELRRTNVEGTANVLVLARAAAARGRLERMLHVSTAYVAGRRRGPVAESSLDAGQGFANAYEQTKHEGERLVRDAAAELPVTVVRPGMIVGDSRTGEVKTFNTFYAPLRLYLSGALHVIPARGRARIDVVPVDYVADAVAALTFEAEAKGVTCHLTAPLEALPTAAELTEFTRGWARARLGVRLPRPLFLPFARFASRRIDPRLLPYLEGPPRFERTNAERLLGRYELDWREFLPRLLAHAVDAGFLHRSERTVFEQALHRLGSRSRPVTVHDVAAGRVTTRSGAQVRAEILTALAALRKLGVREGDRVAIVGANSSRYLTLDLAVGLAGAVSVPLYVTSPPPEVDELLAASRADLLLVGAPGLLERLDELRTTVPCVSFCPGGPPPGLRRAVLAWDEFLALGEGETRSTPARVGFGEPATIRFTSGTTGPAKGVVFHHAHLRWLAETMASLLPWKARTQPARYLSFLPLNHVVEGILATYSAYYLPAAIDLYFLEDFEELRPALRRVRPTIFFCVPRFYEKAWTTLAGSGAGRRYLRASGSRRALLRPLVRAAFLRRAGLDRCAMLVAGSAPSQPELLRALRELGVEVHNAYGLTEAPLVTLNRYGANRIDTVGPPLPATEVSIAEDGEILVGGPQVMAGYLGEEVEQPFRDGLLLTGDLGSLAPEGHLVVSGRKKELIATAYGKKVQVARVEEALKAIPGVAEAMLVGEARPYCGALLWLEHADGSTFAAVDGAIAEVNRRLSHPEQVKRWALLENDLSPERGELTANLKLRRQVVAERLEDVIASLYAEGPPPLSVVHAGRAEADPGTRPRAEAGVVREAVR
jgi:long-chain acyl-CoA synthetase